ncbi:MAG: hypothetical protein QF535_00785, partial [Anaerolineales bacterium]|nr:hypothetical protein [Anaerolineales bacterium]
TFAGDVISTKANGLISGSSSSTGSFGIVKTGDGTINVPAYGFGADPDTGIYRVGSGHIGVTIDGRRILDLAENTISGSSTSTGSFGSVHTAGNVGIGTTSPSRTLDVTGTGRFTSNVDFGGSIYVSSGGHVFLDGGSNTYITEVASDQVAIFTGGSERFRVNASGNVGIGGIVPTARLHIYKGNSGVTPLAGANELFIEDNGGAGITIGSYSSSAGNIFFGDSDDADVGRITYNHPTDTMDFWTSGSSRMVISGSGNVGIGTSSPTTKLHVVGSIWGNATKSDTIFGGSTTDNKESLIGAGGYWALRTDTSNHFHLDTYNGGSPVAALTVQQDGNVGIGTTSPERELEVDGRIRVSTNNAY